MRHFFLIFIITALAAAPYSFAADTDALCNSLERQNIDCSCVADRMNAFQSLAPTETAKTLIKETYAFSVGAESEIDSASKAYADDPMGMVSTHVAMDQLGGMPENISDFEEGCVIPGAKNYEFPLPKANSQAALYVEERVIRTGETYRNNAVCVANRFDSYLSPQEFQAYRLSYSYYEGDHTNDDDASRARKMGISKAKYKGLESSARSKLDKNKEKDESYCSAMTYATRITPIQNQAALDQQVEQAELSQDMTDPGYFLTGSDTLKARRIMQFDCTSNGGTESHCQCVLADFEKKVVQKAPRTSVALSWALMRGGSGIPAEALMQLTMAADPADQQAAGQMFMSTMDVGESCTESVPSPKALKGDPRERMMKICIAENENEAFCKCSTDKMREKLSADDFELIVDIREADFRGASDPLAEVAADRGLTAKETEAAMATNRQLIGGMMTMDMMSCMGGMGAMPDMSQIPVMPKQ